MHCFWRGEESMENIQAWHKQGGNESRKQQEKPAAAPRRLLLSRTLLPPDVTLLSDGELSALALGQRDPWLGALPNNEDVRYPKICSFNTVLQANK